jgi:tetratricopeptide (TPR) repeat protein
MTADTVFDQTARRASHHSRIYRPLTPVVLLFAVSTFCFVLTAIMGVWVAYDRVFALARLGNMGLGLLAMVGIAWFGSVHSRSTLHVAGLVCALCAATVSLTHWLWGHWDTDIVGSTLLVLLPLGMCSVWWSWTHKDIVPLMIASGTSAIGMTTFLLVHERSAAFGLFIGLLCSAYVAWRFRDSNLQADFIHIVADVFVLGCGLVGFVFYWMLLGGWLSDNFLQFLSTLNNDGFFERVWLWQESLALVEDFLFTGSGLGSTGMVYSTYVYLLHVPYYYYADNLFIQLTLEQGVPGLITFLGMEMAAIIGILQVYQQARPSVRRFCMFTLISLVGAIAYGLLDGDLYAAWSVPILFLPLGFALALYGVEQTRAKGSPPFVNSIANTQPSNLWLFVSAVAPVAAIAMLFILPGAQSHWQADLGAVEQSQAELSVYRWPEWPIQDQVRNGKVNLARALVRYQNALESDPDNVTAHERLGQIYLSQRDYGNALRHLEHAYTVAPQRNAIRLLLGELYALQDRPEVAAELWRTAHNAAEQLKIRLWWHQHYGNPQDVERVQKAINLTQ